MLRILMIDPSESNYQRLLSLMEEVEGDQLSMDWMASWQDIQDQGSLSGYDVILDSHNKNTPLPANTLPDPSLQALKDRFITMANHEFRTPMTSIASSADLVEAYVQRGQYEKIGKHVARIKNSVHELTQLLAEILSLKDLENNKIHPTPIEVNLPGLITATVEEFKDLLKPGQALTYAHNGPEMLVIDPNLLKSILLTLLSNASRYSAPDTLVDIKTETGAGEMVIEVIDQGIGIPVEDQPHLFQRFFRAGNTSHVPGTGLGLYVAKSYAEMMQGRIEFSSAYGHGSTFRVIFKLGSA